MKNKILEAQIRNMESSVLIFKQSCKLATTQDDGEMDFLEKRQLKKIENACNKFLKELKGIK